METETEIVAKLKAAVTPPSDTVLAPTAAPEPTNGQATIAPVYDLDELTQYKLHDFFGETYKTNDEEAKQRISYIYERVAGMLEDKDYGFVVAKIRDLERIIGTSNDERRVYKMYQWLKLEAIRKNVDAQMGSLTNGR